MVCSRCKKGSLYIREKVLIGILVTILAFASLLLLNRNKALAPTDVSTNTGITPNGNEETQESSKAPDETDRAQTREITIHGTEFSFSPSNISLKEGEKVRIIFENKGNAPHDWTIEGIGIKTKVIGPGETDTIELTAKETGTHKVYCSVPGHRDAGMEGILTVQ